MGLSYVDLYKKWGKIRVDYLRVKTRGVSRSGFRERDGGIPGRDDLPIPRHRSREFCRETGLAIYL